MLLSDVTNLTYGSKKRVKVQCDYHWSLYCKNIYELDYRDYIRILKNGKLCCRACSKMNSSLGVGKFIKTSWTNMNIRCGKYIHLQTSRKNDSYKGIIIEFSRKEFKRWCIDNSHMILNCKRPSIDRLDKNKNYTLENIQILELEENIRKDKLIPKDGKSTCCRCKEIKDLSLFVKSSKSSTGIVNMCLECERKRAKERAIKKQEKR
jgi:hypothetical protein